MVTTVRDAEAACGYWRRRAQGLEAALPAVAIKGDPVDLDQHIRDLQAARISYRRALEELATVRGRPPSRPVYLNTPVKADQRVPVLSTQEFRNLIQLDKVGVKPANRRLVWQARSREEARELMRSFDLSETKSAGSRRRGFAIERLC